MFLKSWWSEGATLFPALKEMVPAMPTSPSFARSNTEKANSRKQAAKPTGERRPSPFHDPPATFAPAPHGSLTQQLRASQDFSFV